MKQIRLLLFLGFAMTACAAEGIIGFDHYTADPNVAAAETQVNEPNIAELVVIEPVDSLHLTPAVDVIHPHYHLLPLKTELIDASSLPIVLDVFRKDPNHPESEPDLDRIDQLLKKDADEIDLTEVSTLLEKNREKLDQLRKAGLCKRVEWPVMQTAPAVQDEFMYFLAVFPSTEEAEPTNRPVEPAVVYSASEYLDFLNAMQQYGKLIALNIRYHILKGDYDAAAEWLRAGLRVSRQMVRNSNSQLGVIAAANAAVILQQIELWVQMPNSPSLFRSLQDLPSPFLNAYSLRPLVEKQINQKIPRSGMPYYYEEQVEEHEEVLPYYSSELLGNAANRIDRFIAILECLEGLRYYAALYAGHLPGSLTEVTEIRLPDDPVTGRRFLYSNESDATILQTADMRDGLSSRGFCYTIRMTPFSRN